MGDIHGYVDCGGLHNLPSIILHTVCTASASHPLIVITLTEHILRETKKPFWLTLGNLFRPHAHADATQNLGRGVFSCDNNRWVMHLSFTAKIKLLDE